MSSRQSTLNADGTCSVQSVPDVEGADQLDRELRDGEVKWGITAEELKQRRLSTPKPTGDRERKCRECGQRVTATLSGFEAGHAGGRKAEYENRVCSQAVDASDHIDLDAVATLDEF